MDPASTFAQICLEFRLTIWLCAYKRQLSALTSQKALLLIGQETSLVKTSLLHCPQRQASCCQVAWSAFALQAGVLNRLICPRDANTLEAKIASFAELKLALVPHQI